MADEPNKRKRRWFITIMNPDEHGLNKDAIIALLMKFLPLYFCFSYEIAPTTGAVHVHILLCLTNAAAFDTVKKRFPTANIQAVRGSVSECIAYIRKGEQNEDSAQNSYFEYGEPPADREKSASTPKSFQIMEAIKAGASDLEIMESIPGAAYQARNLGMLRQAVLKERYGNELRNVTVIYCYGPTGSGKTMYVFAQAEQHSQVCRITSYKRGLLFDDYNKQDILCLDEFSSSHVPIGEMLTLTDIYPIQLSARYADKTACFTRVFVLSNLRLDELYMYEQIHQPEVWCAFLRRINYVLEFQPDFSIIDRTADYKKGELHNEVY